MSKFKKCEKKPHKVTFEVLAIIERVNTIAIHE